MKIYLITRNDGTNWDESHAFVVKADSEAEARKFAQEQSGDEGSDHTREYNLEYREPDELRESNEYIGKTFWTNTDNKFVSCVIIGHANQDENPSVTNSYGETNRILRGVILRDFNAG